MCKYYIYSYPCGHNLPVFANYCRQGHMIQRACRGGDIAATLAMEQSCDSCKTTDPKRREGKAKGEKRGDMVRRR